MENLITCEKKDSTILAVINTGGELLSESKDREDLFFYPGNNLEKVTISLSPIDKKAFFAEEDERFNDAYTFSAEKLSDLLQDLSSEEQEEVLQFLIRILHNSYCVEENRILDVIQVLRNDYPMEVIQGALEAQEVKTLKKLFSYNPDDKPEDSWKILEFFKRNIL